MVGQARLWVVLIIWVVSCMVSSHEDVCHIPNGCSPLAGLNKDAVRFNFTCLTSMASWETSSLQIADHWHQFSKMDCAAMLSLEMFVVTEFVNTSISLCSSLTGSGIACYESGQSSHRPSVMGEISKFGSCDVGWSSPQTWNNFTAIILSLPFLTYPKADSTTYECHWDPAATRINILNFTLAKIGCPLSYWGANCSIKCPSCENCHTFTGACLPEPVTPSSTYIPRNDATLPPLTTTPNTTSPVEITTESDPSTNSTITEPGNSTASHQSWWFTSSLMVVLVFSAL